MRVTRRIWIDVTGLRPGSDAGLYGLHLARALVRAGEAVRPCLRVPGLIGLSVEALTESLHVQPLDLTASNRPKQNLREPPQLGLLATNVTTLSRPEWRDAREVEEAQIWLRDTAPLLSLAIAQSEEAAQVLRQAGVKVFRTMRGAADGGVPDGAPAHPRPFIFASGEIGEAGQTRQLLPVWRRLLETMPEGSVPDLIIAGPLGPQSNDVLEQLANSQFIDGRARVILYPSPAQIAAFARDCVFAISMSPATGWGRGTLNAQCMGASCLSAFLSHGAVPFDPENAAAVAARIRAWLVDPAVKPPLFARSWDDAARDLLRILPQ